MWNLQLELELGSDKEVGESEGFKETAGEGMLDLTHSFWDSND